MSENFDHRYIRIWKGYKTFVNTAFIMRSGIQLIGLAEMTDADETVPEKFWRRDESTLEHSAKVAYLCGAMMSHFPSFFDDLQSDDAHLVEDWAIIMTALLHDVGEIATGDIPDDGNAMHDAKSEIERAMFEVSMAGAFSREDFQLIRRTYAEFQSKSSHLGKAIYCLDKLEAILQLLWFEQYDTYGLITAKAVPTGQDIHYMKLTSTPCAADCWAAHMKDRIKEFPQEITHHIYELLRVAVIDVRGEWFPWWDKI